MSDIDPTVILHAAGLKHLYDKLVESRKESAELRNELIAANEQIEEFDARLAESRAAMREEAAKVVESDPPSDMNWSWTREKVAAAIRSLPADSSALDARDARVDGIPLAQQIVLQETLTRHEFHSERESRTGDDPAWCSCGEFKPINDDWWDWITHIMRALAQRSAEKGKVEVKYECGCPPRFRVDPKEGKQYEAYCSKHHKPLRRSAKKGRGQ